MCVWFVSLPHLLQHIQVTGACTRVRVRNVAVCCIHFACCTPAGSAVRLTVFRHSSVCELTFFVIPGANGNGASTHARGGCPTL